MISLDHLNIFVRDVARSREWYTTNIGLEIELEIPAINVVALRDTEDFALFLEQRPPEECRPSCILTFRVDDVEAAARSLEMRGVELAAKPQKLPWGYGAELRDPDGYLVRLWDERSMREKG